MALPRCCGEEMKINTEVGRFVETRCIRCGDVVYIRNPFLPQHFREN